MTTTILESSMINIMNDGEPSRCGGIASWQEGVKYDLTKTMGCETLGVIIKTKQYTLIKLEKHAHGQFLLTSELKDNETDFFQSITAFNSKLKKCTNKPKRWLDYSTLPLVESHSICIGVHWVVCWLYLVHPVILVFRFDQLL